MIAFNNNEYLGEQPEPEPVGRLPRFTMPGCRLVTMSDDVFYTLLEPTVPHAHRRTLRYVEQKMFAAMNIPLIDTGRLRHSL